MIRIDEIVLHSATLKTRMPFRYGIAEMTVLPHIFVRMEVDLGGTVSEGIAADHLPPKWFTKEPERDPAGEIADLLAVIHNAAALARGWQGASAFIFWREMAATQTAWAVGCGHPPLLANFGVSLMERALLDAICRWESRPFHQLLAENRFGIVLGDVHPELAGSVPRDWLPKQPLESVVCRHTVGLSDPVEGGELPGSLPTSLVANIRRYGLRQFKIKVAAGEPLQRLEVIVARIGEESSGDFQISLDGNESFASVEAFREFWGHLRGRPCFEPLLRNLLFVEQPFHRNAALGETTRRELQDWPDGPRIIIDESDAEDGSLSRALACGYAGVSHKNCKGVQHGVANACLLAKLRAGGRGDLTMSGEDLSNIGPVALLQDLAVQATLGNSSVERNGHHYFSGLSFWPASIQAQMLDEHHDLYERAPEGWPTLRIEAGQVALGSVNRAAFGVGSIPDAVREMPTL